MTRLVTLGRVLDIVVTCLVNFYKKYGILCYMLWLFMMHLQSTRRLMYFKKHVVYAQNRLRFHATRCIGPTYDLNGQP